MNSNAIFGIEMTKMRDRIYAKRNAIRELEYELKLLENEAQRMANSHEECKLIPFIDSAIDWIVERDACANSQPTNKTNKFAFDMVKECVEEMSHKTIKEVISITMLGLDVHGWAIDFITNDNPLTVYRFEVPNLSDISFKKLEDLEWGRFVLNTTSVGEYNSGFTMWKQCWSGYDSYRLHEYFDNANIRED